MKKVALFGMLILIVLNVTAQRWKKNRWELVGGMGTTFFMGDLGGGSGDAKRFLGVADLDMAATRPAFQVGIRYKFVEVLSARANFAYGFISADDRFSGHYGRWLRNLHFRSQIFEMSTVAELYFIKEKIGSRYAISSGGLRNMISAYMFVGAGFFFYEPQAFSDLQDKWVNLRLLNTEGQGIVEGLEPYSPYGFAFPLGVGVKYNLLKNFAINVEMGLRYTNTDYIDDVSDKYFNYKDYIIENSGKLTNEQLNLYTAASEFTDRHKPYDFENGITTPYKTGKPYRGSPLFNDAYIFTMVSVVYKLKTSRSGLPKFE